MQLCAVVLILPAVGRGNAVLALAVRGLTAASSS